MNCRNLFSVSLLCLFFGIVDDALGQGPGGFAGRMLRRLDRDENGSLDPEELDQAGPLKDYLARQKIDVNRPVPLGVIADYQAGMFQEMRERGEFPGGFGGPPGGFGGPSGPPGDDDSPSDERRGSDSRNRDSRRSGSGSSDGNSNSSPGDDRRSRRSSRRGEESPGGSSNLQPGKAGSKSKVRVGRVGPKANLPPATLPSQYASRDINQDGQIGMYEWSRTDLSTFRNLDRNGDGFLVPAELIAPGTGTSGNSGSVANTTAAPGSTTSASGYAAKGAPAVSIKSSSPPSGPPADLKTVAAQGAFDLLDADKNGQLSEEEWNRSRYAKKLFTEAKVELKFPLPKSNFVETYKKLAP